MKKQTVIIVVCVCVAVLALGALFVGKNTTNSVNLETPEEAIAMFDTIYSKLEGQLPYLETIEMDELDDLTVSAYTGLKSTENVESLIVSEPLTGSQPYSAVLVSVKDGADVEAMKQEMIDNINMNKWICVSAEKAYVTNSGNHIFMIMAGEEWAKPVYDEFKAFVENKVGKELEKTGADFELPPEIIVQ